MASAPRDHGRGHGVIVGRARSGAHRVAQAWDGLRTEQRWAAAAAVGLFFAMALPWYTKTNTFVVKGAPKSTQTVFTAFGAFSFVEAAVLLVSGFVLTILFARGERRAFHLPGGDGTVIAAAGAWASVLIFYRMLDKPSLHGNDVISATEGITWGIFIALLVALGLAYSGWRIRAAHLAEPPLMLDPPRPLPAIIDEAPRPARPAARPASAPALAGDEPPAPVRAGPRRATATAPLDAEPVTAPAERPRFPPPPPTGDARRAPAPRMVTREDAAQLSFDDPPVEEPYDDEPPTRRQG